MKLYPNLIKLKNYTPKTWGIVSSAFVGDDQSADQWRVNTGNYFKDKVSAQKELMEISSAFNK